MSYKSPIEIAYDWSNNVMKQTEDSVINAVYKIGVHVDKDELIKAMAYDREQYKAGYEDGLTDARADAIPVEWIKQQIEKVKNGYRPYWLIDHIEWEDCLRSIIDEWREENEQRKDT